VIADRLGDARRILAIRLDTIGDVIMTTPALGALADSGAEVTLLTSKVSASLQSVLPYLTDLVTLDVPWMKPAERHRERHSDHLEVLRALGRRRFDAAVVFTVSTQDPSCAAYLGYLAGVPRVAAHVRGKLYGLVSDPVPDTDGWPPSRHEVARQLELVERLGFEVRSDALRLDIPAPSRAVRAVLDRVRAPAWCVVHPGATAPSRRYPNDHWSQAINLLQRRGVAVVLAGGRQDSERCAQIARECAERPRRVDGRLTLPELASLLAAAPAAATCNSSAAHLCAAAATPVTTLYAGTNPQHRPWTRSATVLRNQTDCTWCLSSVCKHSEPVCIASIPPERVAESVLAHLGPRLKGVREPTTALTPRV